MSDRQRTAVYVVALIACVAVATDARTLFERVSFALFAFLWLCILSTWLTRGTPS